MTLKWLPNALTIARCILAIVVGYTILDFDTRTQAGDATALVLFLPFALFSFVALTDWLENAGFVFIIYSYPSQYPGIAAITGMLKRFKPFTALIVVSLTLVIAVITLWLVWLRRASTIKD